MDFQMADDDLDGSTAMNGGQQNPARPRCPPGDGLVHGNRCGHDPSERSSSLDVRGSTSLLTDAIALPLQPPDVTDKGWKFEGALEKVMHKTGP